MTQSVSDSSRDERFAFGKNWLSFATQIDEDRIRTAMASLTSALDLPDLQRRSFLDIGSGSGLFSLAAIRLGARRVLSFDYDPDSVQCTQELKQAFCPGARAWQVEQGSVLDADYMAQLGTFDVIYAWGVLHHTGSMWTALANATIPAAAGSLVYIAIYNDQGVLSTIWKVVKRLYCSGWFGRALVLATMVPTLIVVRAGRDLATGTSPFRRYGKGYSQSSRGMSPLRDLIDWLGGYPFEVAAARKIVDFYEERGFEADLVRTTRGSGCNEFVFRKRDEGGSAARS